MRGHFTSILSLQMNLKQCSRTKTRARPTSPNQPSLLRLKHNALRLRPIPALRTPSFLLLLRTFIVPTLDSHNVTNHPRSSQESHHPLRDSHQWIPTQKWSTFLQLPPPIPESQPTLHFFPMILAMMSIGPVGRRISPRLASSATCKLYS
jgi:hypothetical protein